MKKVTTSFLPDLLFLVPGLFLLNCSVTGQEISRESPALPENVNKIVTASCMPCHSSNGGFLSRGKLNFTQWTQYPPEKQKAKAEKMYSLLKKGSMPPKSVRKSRPEIIPTENQIDIIKKWAESLTTENK